jgi:hypothetical protein
VGRGRISTAAVVVAFVAVVLLIGTPSIVVALWGSPPLALMLTAALLLAFVMVVAGEDSFRESRREGRSIVRSLASGARGAVRIVLDFAP